ncbi:MAG: dehydrogenase, partial [Achromobacter sp.]|nr:dehydrogenase [Achromobacter sp.]
FMPDQELDLYQQLEELRYEAEQNGEAFDWNQQKQLLGPASGNTQH